MAASLQMSHNKRVRDASGNGGLALPDAKRSNNASWLMHDSDLVALLEKIDNMDTINRNIEETFTVIELQNESLPGQIMKSLEDEDGLKGKADDIVDEEGSSGMGSIKQDEITDENSEVASVSDRADMDENSEAASVSDRADMHLIEGNLTYYEDVNAEFGFFVDYTGFELEINNLFDGNSVAIMYLDAVYGGTETICGPLWEDDIWQ